MCTLPGLPYKCEERAPNRRRRATLGLRHHPSTRCARQHAFYALHASTAGVLADPGPPPWTSRIAPWYVFKACVPITVLAIVPLNQLVANCTAAVLQRCSATLQLAMNSSLNGVQDMSSFCAPPVVVLLACIAHWQWHRQCQGMHAMPIRILASGSALAAVGSHHFRVLRSARRHWCTVTSRPSTVIATSVQGFEINTRPKIRGHPDIELILIIV